MRLLTDSVLAPELGGNDEIPRDKGVTASAGDLSLLSELDAVEPCAARARLRTDGELVVCRASCATPGFSSTHLRGWSTFRHTLCCRPLRVSSCAGLLADASRTPAAHNFSRSNFSRCARAASSRRWASAMASLSFSVPCSSGCGAWARRSASKSAGSSSIAPAALSALVALSAPDSSPSHRRRVARRQAGGGRRQLAPNNQVYYFRVRTLEFIAWSIADGRASWTEDRGGATYK
eukprot:scaffold57081_cov32-Tisochrysis_lutea.AAC.2